MNLYGGFSMALAPFEAPIGEHDCVAAATMAHAQAMMAGATPEEAIASAVKAFAAHIPRDRTDGKKGRRVRRTIDEALAAHGFEAAGGVEHMQRRAR